MSSFTCRTVRLANSPFRGGAVWQGSRAATVAQQLRRAGHGVTVFEKEHLPGGLLRHGVPEFRLDRALVDRRLDQLRAEGVAGQRGEMEKVERRA